MKYAVLATPPSTGIYAGLRPRLQMYNDGRTVTYDTKEEAERQVRACNADRNGWKYEAIDLPEEPQ